MQRVIKQEFTTVRLSAAFSIACVVVFSNYIQPLSLEERKGGSGTHGTGITAHPGFVLIEHRT